MKICTVRTGLLAAAASALATSAFAGPAIGLVGDRTLVMFDTASPAVTATMEVSGVESLVGIDVRPGDGKLYGVGADGTIVTIDTATGAATPGAKLSTSLEAGAAGMVDFNPAADRLRIMGVDGTNLRANVDTGEVTVDGKLNFEPGDANASAEASVVATAYTNSVGKPEATAMYDIHAGLGALLRQTKPNDGTLATIGMLGIEGAETFAFDIESRAVDDNTAWLVAGNGLYTVDLGSGAATMVGEITGVDGAIRDIAILPAM